MERAELTRAAWRHTEIRRPAHPLPDWDDLRLLLSVVEEGSLGRASRVLGLTQPTMSRRIRRLENDLGTSLLTRSSRGVTLTFQAQIIIDELKAAHAAIARAIGRSPGGGAEEFKLVTTDSLASHWLPRFLGGFIERQPDVDLRIFASDNPNSNSAGHYDFAVHDMPPSEPNLLTTRLGTFHFVPFASRGYLERHGSPASCDALGGHRLLDCSAHLVDHGSWMARLPQARDKVRARYYTNSAASLAEAVKGDAGIALLPTFVAAFEPELVALEIGIHFARPFWLNYRRELLLKAGAGKVLAFLKQTFDRRTMPWFGDAYRGARFADALPLAVEALPAG